MAVGTTTAYAGQFIVGLNPGAIPGVVASRAGMTLLDTAPGSPFALFNDPSNSDVGTGQALLLADPDVAWAEDNAEVSESEGQNGKGSTVPVVRTQAFSFAANVFDNQTSSTQIGFTIPLEVRGVTKAPRVRVAVLDNGLSPLQPRLWSKVAIADSSYADPAGYYDTPVGTDWNGDGFVDNAVGHGTMVAGLVLTYAPNARLVIVKVSNSDGMSTSWRIAKGIAIAAKAGAKVITMALGSQRHLVAMTNVTDWADAKGIVMVAPAGNQGINLCMSPADARKVFAVTSVDSSDIKTSWANYSSSVMLSVPGSGIASAWYTGGSALWSGSSFGVPIVAAAVADLLAVKPAATPQKIRQALTQTSVSIDALNPNFKGRLGGLLQADKFVAAVK